MTPPCGHRRSWRCSAVANRALGPEPRPCPCQHLQHPRLAADEQKRLELAGPRLALGVLLEPGRSDGDRVGAEIAPRVAHLDSHAGREGHPPPDVLDFRRHPRRCAVGPIEHGFDGPPHGAAGTGRHRLPRLEVKPAVQGLLKRAVGDGEPSRDRRAAENARGLREVGCLAPDQLLEIDPAVARDDDESVRRGPPPASARTRPAVATRSSAPSPIPSMPSTAFRRFSTTPSRRAEPRPVSARMSARIASRSRNSRSAASASKSFESPMPSSAGFSPHPSTVAWTCRQDCCKSNTAWRSASTSCAVVARGICAIGPLPGVGEFAGERGPTCVTDSCAKRPTFELPISSDSSGTRSPPLPPATDAASPINSSSTP